MSLTSKAYALDPSDEKKLAGGKPVYTVGLRKGWAKKPTYWLSLFKVTRASIEFFFVVRSWKWPRNGEVVQGSILSQRYTTRGVALEAARGMLTTLQDEKEYVIDNVAADAADLSSAETAWLAATGKFGKGDEGGKSPTQEDPESNFDKLQKKRKGKAYW